MVIGASGKRHQRGVAYFWVLLMVLIISLGLGNLIENVAVANQRAREAELLYTGALYRNAIRQYYRSTPIGAKPYPEKLEDLLRDPRYPVTRRYLRKLHPDPITGKAFLAIYSPDGGVMGIRSASLGKPIKVAGFYADDTAFAAAQSFQQWEFTYAP